MNMCLPNYRSYGAPAFSIGHTGVAKLDRGNIKEVHLVIIDLSSYFQVELVKHTV